MKYVKSGTFTNQEFSLDETIQEVMDVVYIASAMLNGDPDPSDIKRADANLQEAQKLLALIRDKAKIAVGYVPHDVQMQHCL